MPTDVNRNLVILCDDNGTDLGTCDKLTAHTRGLLHRAFSILVFNAAGELLIQRRAANKYHSGGLWANTCCSHDTPGENLRETVHRRLREEVGFDCELAENGSFVYDFDVGAGMREYERDSVFVGRYDGPVAPNPEEVSELRWATLEAVRKEAREHPERFAVWFREILRRLSDDGEILVAQTPEIGYSMPIPATRPTPER